MNIDHNLTQVDFKNVDVKPQLEDQIQIQETQESVWILDKINSMKKRFCKTGEFNGSSYVKIPLRSNVILNIKNSDKYCFFWSTLFYLHPCESSHPSRVRNYIQYFNDLNIEGFDFTNGFR